MSETVCLLSQFYYPIRGGIARYAYDLSLGLAEAGADVHVVTLRPKGRASCEEIGGVNVHRVGGGQDPYFVLAMPLMAKKARRLCEEERVDIIHGQIPHVPDACLPKSGLRARLVETIHVPLDVEAASLRLERFGDLIFWEKFVLASFPLSRIVERRLVRRADGLISLSEATRRDAARSYGMDEGEIRLIHGGIFVENFTSAEGQEVRERLKLGEDPMILYVGRHCARKRLGMLIRAVLALKKRHRDVRLVIVGRETGYTRRLRRLVSELNLGDSVFFTGYVPDRELPKYYSACDVFALTSRHEALGLTVLEAMASGKPVIAPNVGGLPEVVLHGKTGLLFSAFRGLVEGISAVITDEKLARRMGAAGRERVARMFTCRKMARETLQYYKEVLSA
ncbi:TPA: glycosyltransferase family 1 protein [Candidatus Bathyarchaeota archaeon]|nr:glycosyltransferase family 1 protein [Candidatus Bathyarchaeota archaeon]